MENKPSSIIWHHSADLSTGHQAIRINEYHKEKGFGQSSLGYYGGYHILIEKDGTTFRFRNDNEIGCHTFNHNQNTLGICLAGNFDIEVPTQAQHEALHGQLDKWMVLYGIPREQIWPHRRFRNTACPGHKLYDNWAREILNDPLPKQSHDISTLKYDPCR